jgi:NAD-dependent SIR2 family protein deacetylase
MLLDQLSAKRRSYDDLSRFIRERVTGVPNYCLLMGAGCSVSSGIRSGGQLVQAWRRELFERLNPGLPYDDESAIKYLSEKQGAWYSYSKEYSSLFEKIYDLPRQRRMFVEKEVSDKEPNLGYAYLTRLVDGGYFNTMFTTNFDDLINEAFFQFSQTRPVVCAHDSSISSITVTSKRPKIIKLHGDYLFDDIKSTMRETESLEENIKKKMVEFGRDFGLVVVGYNGGDRSVMDVLHYLLRNDDYLKNGIYWCIRRGESPSEDLQKLLWRDRAYYVEIDGFDEIMADLHNDMIGNSLPIDTSIFTDKPRKIISDFCSNDYLKNSNSEIIKRDLEKLRVEEGREQLVSAVRISRKDVADAERSDGGLDDRELFQVMEVKQLISAGDFAGARLKISDGLASSSSIKMRHELLLLKVSVENLSGDLNAALIAAEDVIKDDPNNVFGYIRKSALIPDYEGRIDVLEEARRIDPDRYQIYDTKLDYCIEYFRSGLGGESALRMARECFDSSVKYEPGLRNESWSTMIDFLQSEDVPRDYLSEVIRDVLKKLEPMGLKTFEYLKAQVAFLSKQVSAVSDEETNQLIRKIRESTVSKSKSDAPFFIWLELDALRVFKKNVDLSRRIGDLDLDPIYASKRGFLKRKADFLMSYSGDLRGAISCMEKACTDRRMSSDILRLARLYKYDSSITSIDRVEKKYSRYLDPSELLKLKLTLLEAKHDLSGVLAALRSSYSRHSPGVEDLVIEVHTLLLLGREPEAASVAKTFLEKISWNRISGGPLIVNYELARKRQGEKVDRARLAEVADQVAEKDVQGCCYFLLDVEQKAKDCFISILKEDKGRVYEFKEWSIFKDDVGKSFFRKICVGAGISDHADAIS